MSIKDLFKNLFAKPDKGQIKFDPSEYEGMFIIVGLGNPGREYANTRHNAGYMAVNILADRAGIDVCRHNFRSVYGEGRIGSEKVVLAKPETFMNNSGFAVRDLVNWYKPENDHILLIYDDADIPAGTLRIRERGSAGSHNGMKSVVYQLGFDDFPRVRIGIGAASHGMIGHVLGSFTEGEKPLVAEALKDAADAAELIIGGRLSEAQARFNRKGKNDSGAKSSERPS